jgi:hypothetical protein
MVKKEDVELLGQLAQSLQKAEIKLEEAYQKKNYDDFNKIKRFIMAVQAKISEVLE